MKRLGWLGLAAILLGAIVAGVITADTESRLQSVAMLVVTDHPGCEGRGQLWVQLGNAGKQTVVSVDGIVSIAEPGSDGLVPVGNFHLDLSVPPLGQASACIWIDEAALAGRDRASVSWLARATAVTLAATESGQPATQR